MFDKVIQDTNIAISENKYYPKIMENSEEMHIYDEAKNFERESDINFTYCNMNIIRNNFQSGTIRVKSDIKNQTFPVYESIKLEEPKQNLDFKKMENVNVNLENKLMSKSSGFEKNINLKDASIILKTSRLKKM